MITPPIGVHDFHPAADIFAQGQAKNLSLRLEGVIASRKEATPNPEFQSDDVEQCYQWICTELRKYFKPHEAEKLRTGIAETNYWEREGVAECPWRARPGLWVYGGWLAERHRILSRRPDGKWASPKGSEGNSTLN